MMNQLMVLRHVTSFWHLLLHMAGVVAVVVMKETMVMGLWRETLMLLLMVVSPDCLTMVGVY